MNITVTTFLNPFSFFCVAKNVTKDFNFVENKLETNPNYKIPKTQVSDVQHGQYVAVMWYKKWTRGVITLESQFLIWLIDYGIYLRPNEKTVYTNLPLEYRKYPTKVFEASIHGIVPVDKVLNDDCEIEDQIASCWNKGAEEKVQMLLQSAIKTFFIPIAVLSTKHNDVVIGDLFIEIPNYGVVNIADELLRWPVFLEKNKDAYLQNLDTYYTSRRRHRACLLKPEFHIKLPIFHLPFSNAEYDKACVVAYEYFPDPVLETSVDDVSSTVINLFGKCKKENKAFRLSSTEIEQYANINVTVNDREFNILNVLINKIKDLNICERYKDHDLKSVGCGTSRPMFIKRH